MCRLCRVALERRALKACTHTREGNADGDHGRGVEPIRAKRLNARENGGMLRFGS